MDNKQPKRTGRPGDTILGKIEQVAKGENWSVSVECRDFQGQPIANPEDHDFIVTIGESERDENPFAEFHIWDPQIELTDPAKATFTASFKRSDMVLLAEGNEYFINYWSEPKDKSIEGRVRQARDAIRLLPSVEPKFVSSGRLAAVGFPSLLGSTSLTPYEIDPRDGFSGGKAPMGFVATIDGVTEAIPDTLVLERDQVVDRDITVSAFDARGDVRSTIFHQTTYPALSFVGLADVEEEEQDGGTVTVSLAGGWTGGYGNRTYTATAGAISGSNLILPISEAGTATVTLTATDEDGNTVPGTIQLTIVEATVSDTVPAQMAAPAVTSSTAGQFTATFSAPANDGGQPITRYDIQFSTDGANWTGAADVTSPHTETEVPAGDYFVQVRAANSVGNGPYSPSGEVTVAAVPIVTAPTAAGALVDQSFTEGTGVETLATAGDFTDGGGTLTFSLPTKPAGVTIDSATGVISFDTDAMAVVSGASVVVRATNSAGFADSAFSVTVEAAASPYTPTIVQASNIELSRDIAPATAKPILLVVADVTPVGANINTNTIWQSSKYAPTDLTISGGGVPVGKCAFVTATGTGSATSSGEGITADTNSAIVFAMEVGANQRLWNATSTSPMALRDTDVLTGSTELPTFDTTMTLFRFNRTVRTSGIAIFALDALPAGFDPSQLFDENRRCKSRAAMAAYLGAEPIWSIIGLNADQLAAGEAEGTETGAVAINEGTDGAFTTIQQGSAGGGGDPEPEPSGTFITASDDYAALVSGTYHQPLFDADMAALGALDYDYSGWTLNVDRNSIVMGEGVHFWFDGPSERQKATWGFIWEFDTSGEFQHLPMLPWHMRQKNRAVGHHQTCAWDTLGVKTAKVRVVPPAWTGFKGKTFTVQVDNLDPDVVFAGRTAIVDLTDSFAGAPTGTQFDTWAGAYNQVKSWNGGRILIKRGQTIVLDANSSGTMVRVENAQSGIYFDAWGDEADPLPIFDCSAEGFDWGNGNYVPYFYMLKNVKFVGGYDGVSGDNTQSEIAIRSIEGCPTTLNNVQFTNVEDGFLSVRGGPAEDGILVLWDCHGTHWENFGIWCTEFHRVMFAGCDISQDPDIVQALDKFLGGPKNHPDHGPFRQSFGEGSKFVFTRCKFFTCNGWTPASSDFEGWGALIPATQPTLRIASLSMEGSDILVSECLSSGQGLTAGGGNDGEVLGAGFAVIRGNYHIGNAVNNGIGHGISGFWTFDNIIITPKGPYANGNSNVVGGFGFRTNGYFSTTAAWETKANQLFCNTIVLLTEQNDVKTSAGGANTAAYTDIIPLTESMEATANNPAVTVENNLIWAPNYILDGEAAPRIPDGISDIASGTFGPAPEFPGRRQHIGGVTYFEPMYATDPASRVLPAISATSTLKGTADTEWCSALDFFGRIRPAAPSPVAIEPEVRKKSA